MDTNQCLDIEPTLLQHIIAGDEVFFKVFFQKYHRQIYAHAFKYASNEDLAEEITQEVFIDIWQYRHALQSVHNIGGYLFKIIRNKALLLLKKQVKQEMIKRGLPVAQPTNPTLNTILDKENTTLLNNCIEQLPPKRKEIYILRKQEGRSIQQIASRMRISENTVKNQLKAAGKFIKGNMEHII